MLKFSGMNSHTIHKINALIIEDEAHNSRMLYGLIEKLRPEWNVPGILESVEESVEWFNKNKAPEVILMDIQLSDGICFSIFDQVKIDPSTRIIFTTAYDEYAIKAFKVNSIDYLLKPIEENELEEAFQKFEQLFLSSDSILKSTQDYERIIHSLLKREKEYRTRFLISGISGFKKIEVQDLAYFYSDNKVVFAVDFNEKEHLLDYNLEQLEFELDPKHFFRANRKVIVNINAIIKVANELGSKLKVELSPQPKFEIIVSRLKAHDFKIWMGK